MKEITGDFWYWAPDYEAIVCTINTTLKSNGELVMGKGIAKDFSQRYTYLPRAWGRRIATRARLGKRTRTLLTFTKPRIFALVTKLDWRKPSTIELLNESLVELLEEVNTVRDCITREHLSSVLMTRPGCGNGGLDWEGEVRPLMEKLGFDDRFTVIHGK